MIKLSGKINKIFNSIESPTFKKRIVWLEEVSEIHPNIWQLELWNADCDMINNYKVGDYVTCYVDIKGKLWLNEQGTERVMNTIKCWNIEKDGIKFKKT